MIHETGFAKHPKTKDSLKSVWNSMLAQSNAKRIEIVYDSHLENSIEESKRNRRKDELKSSFTSSLEIKKFWASSVNKKTPTIVAIFFYYVLNGCIYVCVWVCVCVCVCVGVCVCTSIHREGFIYLDQLEYQEIDQRCYVEDVCFL